MAKLTKEFSGAVWPRKKRAEKDKLATVILIGAPQMGVQEMGFKQIRGYLRKKALLLRFLHFPFALRALQKSAKKAEKG